MSKMSIEELVKFQAEHDLGDEHVVFIGDLGWTCAHSDDERAEGLDVMIDCPINDWLESWGVAPAPIGIYIAVTDDWEDWELIPLRNPEED